MREVHSEAVGMKVKQGEGVSGEEPVGMRLRLRFRPEHSLSGLSLPAPVWGHGPAPADVGTHWRGSACFCRKVTAAGALQATYLWMN